MSFYIKLPITSTASVGGAGLTDAELRASPVPVDIGAATVNITGPVTVSNEVEIKNDAGNPIPVDAVNFDIRDLQFAQDKVDASGSTVNLSAGTIAAIQPVAGGATLAEQQSQTSIQQNIDANISDLITEVQSLNSTVSTVVEQQTQTTVLNNIETELQSANISLASIDAHVDGVEDFLSSIDSKLITSSTGGVPATSSVTTSTSVVVPSNASRKGLVIVNLTSTRVFLAFDGNIAAPDSGIMLVNGGSYSMDAFSFTTGAVQAVTASGTTVLSIQEFA